MVKNSEDILMPEGTVLKSKIPSEKQSGFNGSFEKDVVGSLLADDLINLLAFMVVKEIERSTNTT
ncbi:hypothetical protein ES703_17145 [subsurface metagenome]